MFDFPKAESHLQGASDAPCQGCLHSWQRRKGCSVADAKSHAALEQAPPRLGLSLRTLMDLASYTQLFLNFNKDLIEVSKMYFTYLYISLHPILSQSIHQALSNNSY